jgi:salicylate hydroxylase
MVGYPIRNCQTYNIVALKINPGSRRLDRSDIEALGNDENVRDLFSSADPTLSRIFGYINDCSVWQLSEVPALSLWVSERATIALIGDAAHAMAPHLAQGAATSIEDGIVLAECLRRIHSKDDLRVVLCAYQTLRKDRVEAIADKSRDLATARAILKNNPKNAEGGSLLREIGKSSEIYSIAQLYYYNALKVTEQYFLNHPIIA